MNFPKDENGIKTPWPKREVDVKSPVPEVEFFHYRLPANQNVTTKKGSPSLDKLLPLPQIKERKLEVNPRGGATYCRITIPNTLGLGGQGGTIVLTGDPFVYEGLTVCSMSENFSYKKGRKKALFRARLAMQLCPNRRMSKSLVRLLMRQEEENE